MSQLSDVDGNIQVNFAFRALFVDGLQIPGLAELVDPCTEAERAIYSAIDFDKDDYW